MQEEIYQISQAIIEIYRQFSEKQLNYAQCQAASADEITAWEKEIGQALPEDYRKFLAQNEYEFNIAYNYELLSLKRAKSDWEMMKTHLEEGTFDDGRVEQHIKNNFGNWTGQKIKQVWWSTQWIPFASDSCGNMLCIDLDPGEKGQQHQIISMEVQDGQGPFINMEYLNFKDCLLKNLSYLQNEKYYLEDYGDGIKWPSIDPYA
jgi:cell wall assembly regulator SMI1